jgi:hypothetical protein
MHRADAKKIAVALLGAVVLAGLLLIVLALVNVESGVVAGTGTKTIGWIVPIVAGAVIGAVAFLLLDEGRARDRDEGDLSSATCGECGSEIITEWRMCPHCGEILDRDLAAPTRASSRSETV